MQINLIGVSPLFKYLQVGDLEGAVLHQADPAVVPQDPLAVFLPLDAGHGVAHDVAVQLGGGTGSQRVIGRSLADDGRDAVRRRCRDGGRNGLRYKAEDI